MAFPLFIAGVVVFVLLDPSDPRFIYWFGLGCGLVALAVLVYLLRGE